MSTRIHTSTSDIDIQVDTITNVAAELGYEHTADEAEDRVLILNDGGNQEAWVITGDEDEWTEIGRRILFLTDLGAYRAVTGLADLNDILLSVNRLRAASAETGEPLEPDVLDALLVRFESWARRSVTGR